MAKSCGSKKSAPSKAPAKAPAGKNPVPPQFQKKG